MERQPLSKVKKSPMNNRDSVPSRVTSTPAHSVHVLQKSVGNQALHRLIESKQVQAKLRISQPNDPDELEADRLADRVMRMPEGHLATMQHVSPHPDTIQPKCSGCEEESVEKDELLRKESPVGFAAQPSPHSDHVSKAIGGGGRGLSAETRAFFEPRLGYKLDGVRIHTGGDASTSAQIIGAEAYTLGTNIVFNENRYQPETYGGKQLLAHELAHVTQQLSRGKLSKKIQPYIRECKKLISKRSIAGLIRGVEAHSLITEDFKSKVSGAMGVSIPGATFAPYRTEAICGGPSTMINSQKIGNINSYGIPDLARRNGKTLEIAEIKPAAIECLIEGEFQLGNYINQANDKDKEMSKWRKSKQVKVNKIIPMKRETYKAKTIRVLDVQGELKIEMAWCTPGLLAYKVSLDTSKKKKDKKSKDKPADPDAPNTKKPATDTPDSPDTKKPHTDTPDALDTKTPKAKPKLQNVGFGICLFCDVGGGGNVGVGVGILVDGQSYGTVSAGVVYDTNGNAVGTVSAGAGKHQSGDAAGVAGASVGSDVSGESALSAGVTAAKDSSSNSLGAASVGTSTGSDVNAVANAAKGDGSKAQGTSILEADKGGPQDAGVGTTHGMGEPADAGTTEVSGDKSVGAGGTRVDSGDAGTKPDVSTGKGAGTSGTKHLADAGVARMTDAGAGGTDESPGLQIPGTTPEQLSTTIAQAAELDALLQSATPAQREFMEFLSKQERAGYFPVSKLEWVKNVLNATQGLDEQRAQTLRGYSWADSNVSHEDLKSAVVEALKRPDVVPNQTSHNYIYGQNIMLPFTYEEIDWKEFGAVSHAALKHSDALEIGKSYTGLIVWPFKKNDGSYFYAYVFEVATTYQSFNKDNPDGLPHHFAFGQELVFVDANNKVVFSIVGFRARDEFLNKL